MDKRLSPASSYAAAAVFLDTDTDTDNPDQSDTDNSSIYRNQYLNRLNKFSHMISKPHNFHLNHQRRAPPTISHHQLQPHHSSGVYNVDKEDFRSVVQKLTGSGTSSSNDRFSPPPPPLSSRTPISSRLQSIRPPSLDGVRPLFTLPTPPPPPPPPPSSDASTLPPFPTGIPQVESPVSAYLRRLQSSIDDADLLLNAIASCSPHLPLQLPDNSFSADADAAAAEPPCMLSPALPVDFAHIPMMSPGVLLSPTTSQIGFPPPPMSPFPSPTWNDM